MVFTVQVFKGCAQVSFCFQCFSKDMKVNLEHLVVVMSTVMVYMYYA